MARADYIGLRVARWRDIAGMTQQELADRIGKSREYVSMIENGHRPVTKRSLLHDFAAALGVSVTDLLGQPETPRSLAELEIYSAVPALRGALDDDPETSTPINIARLAADVDRAQAARMSCDYSTLAALLPGVVADSRRLANSAAGEREGLALFVRAAFCAALVIKPMGYLDLAARLAERAELAAQLLGSAEEQAAAAYVSAQAALASGTSGGRRRSLAVAERAADAVGDSHPGGGALSMYGMLRLHASLSAASLGRTDDAVAHYAEAESAAARAVGDPWWMDFAPANVGVWRVNIALENGEAERAPEYAKRVDRSGLRTKQRLVHLHIGTGRGLYLAGRGDAAVRQFLAADDLAPLELRPRPSVREIVGQMVRDSRRQGSAELGELATRLGIDPLDPNYDQE